MKLNEYQDAAMSFAIYKCPTYPFWGLLEEAGEVAGKIAKPLRKHGVFPVSGDPEILTDIEAEIVKELGDVLWMVSACANELGLPLEELAALNLEKLYQRRERDVIEGEGDNR